MAKYATNPTHDEYPLSLHNLLFGIHRPNTYPPILIRNCSVYAIYKAVTGRDASIVFPTFGHQGTQFNFGVVVCKMLATQLLLKTVLFLLWYVRM